jgi:DNA-binding response OmpR family regulator
LDFLKILKADERFRRMPVVILTTSREESDRLHSFNLGVAGYMTKPVDYAKFVEVMRTIQTYWTTSEMPP